VYPGSHGVPDAHSGSWFPPHGEQETRTSVTLLLAMVPLRFVMLQFAPLGSEPRITWYDCPLASGIANVN
jgi:hypothetical protein